MNAARDPKGTTTGGQFASTSHGEPEVSLAIEPESEPPTFEETQSRRRGHNFYPKSEMKKWPALYTHEDKELHEVPIQAHYFQGGCDWYVSEFEPKTGLAFGYAKIQHGEWGYFDLREIEAARGQFGLPIERDCDFKRGTLSRDCIQDIKDDADPSGTEVTLPDGEPSF